MRHPIEREGSLGCRCKKKWETPNGVKRLMVQGKNTKKN